MFISRIAPAGSGIEFLEGRIAPASVSFSFPEFDGDIVTIKSSVGSRENLQTAAHIVDDQLQEFDLSTGTWGTEFANAVITISVKKSPVGNGFAEVGFLNAAGIDLQSVAIKGDLGRIHVGDSTTATPAIRSLTVASMGQFGLETQGPSGSIESTIHGTVRKFSVSGDLRDVSIAITGGSTDGNLGFLSIGGSLIGSSGEKSGLISVDGTIEKATINGDIRGGAGNDSGGLSADGPIQSVRVGGALLGGGGFNSGRIHSETEIASIVIRGDLMGGNGIQSGTIVGSSGIGGIVIRGTVLGGAGEGSGAVSTSGFVASVRILRDLIGRDGNSSGSIFAFGGLGRITLGGSLIGGTGDSTGAIVVQGDIGTVEIARDVIGGSISGTDGNLTLSGAIRGGAKIGSVSIGGSIRAGIDQSTMGDLVYNASILAGNDLGSLSVGGSIVGTSDENGVTRVLIGARGQVAPGALSDLAIGKINVGGSVIRTQILAGFIFAGADIGANGDASIGAVKVRRDWIASDLVAGVDKVTEWGRAENMAFGGLSATLVSTIASITIGGSVTGTPDSVSSTDHFGFVAQQIGMFKEGKIKLAPRIAATDSPVELSRLTGDVTVREV